MLKGEIGRNIARWHHTPIKATIRAWSYQQKISDPKNFLKILEASSHDRINMTKFWLEYEQKNLQRRTLTLEHDWQIYNDKH